MLQTSGPLTEPMGGTIKKCSTVQVIKAACGYKRPSRFAHTVYNNVAGGFKGITLRCGLPSRWLLIVGEIILAQKITNDPKEVFHRNARGRFYRALDYLTLFLYVTVVSIGALVADLLIVYVIALTVKGAVSKYNVVAVAFDWFQIGSAFLVLIGALTHACFSAFSQVKFEVETSIPTVEKAE